MDLTLRVMAQIKSLEQKRVTTWILACVVIILAFIAILVSQLIIVNRQLTEQNTWDLVHILDQDWEIVRDYGQDTLITFWEELPQEEILDIMLIIGLLGLVIFWAKKPSYRIARKIKYLTSKNKKS